LIGKAEITYKVRLTAKANKVYSEADSILKKKIAKCLKLVQETPKNHPQIIDDSQSQVIVLLIEHRSQAYRQ